MPKRNEILKFSTAFQGTNRATANTTIVDTSYPMTYNSKWSTNAAGTNVITETNEGTDVYFVITTDNVPNGTVVRVLTNATGLGVDSATVADFNNYQYTQDVIVTNGIAAAKISIAADKLTENRESFYAAALDLNGTVLTTAYLYINDTSKTPEPTYEVSWTSSATSTTPITNVNEGSTAWLIVKTTNVRDNHGLGVIFTGAAATLNDISGTITNNLESAINIVNGIGRLAVTVKADNLTEGNELLTAVITDGGVSKVSANLTIVDTSKSYTVSDIYINAPSDPDGVYNSWGIVNGEVNILERFLYWIGRAPTTNDGVRVIIPRSYAVVAPSVTGYALNFAGFPAGTKITLEVYGMVLGRGGAGAYNRNPQAGGAALYSDGNSIITINTYGTEALVSGGGGGGGGYSEGSGQAGGGGGAPYGLGQARGTNGTLFTGGGGGSRVDGTFSLITGARGGGIGGTGAAGTRQDRGGTEYNYGAGPGPVSVGSGFSAINAYSYTYP